MDIPLPEDPQQEETSLENIPVPEDTNRYSPSLPIEDDPTEFKPDLSEISLPSFPPKRNESPSKSVVLGKSAAKKRLLAFSMAKHNVGQQKKSKTEDEKGMKDEPASSSNKKKHKKGVMDKARDTISEIEELKRLENEARESMQFRYPLWGSQDDTSLILKPDSSRVAKVENLLETVMKKSKHERRDHHKHRSKHDRYDTEEDRQERRERRDKREEDRRDRRDKRDKERVEPKNWEEFTKAGYKAYHFRRVKYKWEKIMDPAKRKHHHRV